MSFFDDPEYGKRVVARCESCGAEFLGTHVTRDEDGGVDLRPAGAKECRVCGKAICERCEAAPCEECGERLHEACAERMLAGLMHPECRKAYLARLAKEDPEGAVAEYRFLAERLERQAGVYRANFAVVRAVLAEDIKDRYGYAAKLGAIACIANLPLCPADMAQILTLLHKRAEAA